ncbi:Dynactin subunit 1 [Acropora cervicornis]|uniref:Dynactin subunit 1 n=1 Tax=Acropora cervicornis TaxID=6130 RepID=A0AAD9QSH5_ACRCE|nr:Dynactin subunit 1 [Acropora cervicornis]
MVFFHNINPGARVQVKWRGEIESGTIRYAGSLVAKDGDWVGVELDNAVGNTSGLFKGIQYFHCRNGHDYMIHTSQCPRHLSLTNPSLLKLKVQDKFICLIKTM